MMMSPCLVIVYCSRLESYRKKFSNLWTVEKMSTNNHEANSGSQIARIPINLRAKKFKIAIRCCILIFTSGILPIAGYFALRYATTLKVTYILSIFTPIFGVVSFCSFIIPTISLASTSSTCRPLGSTRRWALDYFNWNFALGIVYISNIIAIGIAQTPSNVKIVSLPLSILLLQVCAQMVLLIPARALHLRTPFRISSCAKGKPVRPAVYMIAENVVAVDAKQGDIFRAACNARYESSPEFRRLLSQLDFLWGISGVLVAGAIIGTI